VGQVEAGSMKGEMFISWGSKNFAVDTFNWFAWEGIQGGTWDRSSKIDQDWECGRQGRNTRDNMSWERVGPEGERIGSEEEVGSSRSLRYGVVEGSSSVGGGWLVG